MLKNIQNIIPLIRMERENMIQNINLQIGVPTLQCPTYLLSYFLGFPKTNI